MPDEPRVLRIGEWRVDPDLDELSREGQTIRLEPRTMRLLLYLAARAGRVVDVQHLLDEVWPNVIVTQGSVYQAVAELRRILGDDREHPSYIENLPRRGYRLIAPVAPWNAAHSAATSDSTQSATGSSPMINAPIPAELQSVSAGPHLRAKTGTEAATAPRPLAAGRSRRSAVLGGITLAAVIVAGLAVGAFWRVSHMQVQGARVAGKTEVLVTPVTFAPPPHSIAVLPFVNISGNASQEYFSDGMSEELLNALSRIDGLQVAAHTSSFYFKGKDVDLNTIARKLNVAAILEGSVRRSGQRVRISAQLVNTVTGFHLWSGAYDRDLGDVLKLQAEIATAVASALKVTLLGDAAAKIEVGGTHDPAAFDAYLRATKAYIASMWSQSGKEQQAAIAVYTEAIRLDLHYALAYAGRSIALSAFARENAEGLWPFAPTLDKALADARKAIALAPDLSEGHMALAMIFERSLDFTRASQEYALALALAPGDARLLRNYGFFAVQMGQTEAGLAAVRRSVVLDPMNVIGRAYLGEALVLARRYGEAILALREAPNVGIINAWRGYAYYASGDFESARAACENADEVNKLPCLAITYDKLGRHDDAEAMLAKLRTRLGDAHAVYYAMIYAQWGDTARALDWLETALRHRDTYLVYVKASVGFDPLRKEPRFLAVERALKFPD
jgi:TolB-like protein/DNA-binding winged helix-turn-helix (wHTH) protein/Tfp pilus assembly protein PilF